MSLKSKLILDTLIQENDANYLNYRNSDLEYKLVDSILQEAMQLFEDEGDGHFKRNWGKYAAGLGVGGVLANGGTFGAGAQHATQSMMNAAKNIGHTGFDKASAGLDKSADYYSHGLSKLDPNSTHAAGEPLPTAGTHVTAAAVKPAGEINPTPTYYGSDGKAINPDTANEFSQDWSHRIGDAAEKTVDTISDRAGGALVGAGLGAGAGALIGKKLGNSKLGMKIGGGLGGLAGSTLPYLKASISDPALGSAAIG